MKKSITLLTALLTAFTINAMDIAGYWEGVLKVGGQQLRLAFNIKKNENGRLSTTMDSPDQGAFGIPTGFTEFKDNNLIIKVPSIGGSYRAEYNAGMSVFIGEWKQGGGDFALSLRKKPNDTVNKRPQTPQPPFPYNEKEIKIINHKDNVTLAGTLTFPKKGKGFPAILMATGSGPQDRDETIMGHKPFWVIADYLTRLGFAVLRFDDRGTGQSDGDFQSATLNEFVNDVEAGISLMKQMSLIDHEKIGILGHSEGGAMAILTAARNPEVGFLILLAAPAVNGHEMIMDQAEAISRQMGVTEDTVFRNMEQQHQLLDIVKSDEDIATAREKMREILVDQPNLWPQVDIMLTEQYRTLIRFDPGPALSKVKCPVLALNGTKDLQVLAEKNLGVIEHTLQENGNDTVETIAFPGVNHLFQTADSGLPDEYGKIEETIAPEVLEAIGSWLTELTE